MSIKSAAQLALLGLGLLTILVVARFVRDLSAVIDGLLPVMTLVASAVYVVACVTVLVFLYVFQKLQS
jgi:hypothetical protein